MKKTLAATAGAILVILGAVSGHAANDSRSYGFLVGYGMSFVGVNDERTDNIVGGGIFLEGSYGTMNTEWFEPQFYAGLAFTSTRESTVPEELKPSDVSASTVFAGARVRFSVPFPQVAPFLELGLGGSLGSVTTRVGDLYDEHGSGILMHVPVSLGLALGEDRRHEVSLSYQFYPHQDHGVGVVGFGMHFGASTPSSSVASDEDLGLY